MSSQVEALLWASKDGESRSKITFRCLHKRKTKDIFHKPVLNSKTTTTVMTAQMMWLPKSSYGASSRTRRKTKERAVAILNAWIVFFGSLRAVVTTDFNRDEIDVVTYAIVPE